jgi:ubiquitin-activating enzyme E1
LAEFSDRNQRLPNSFNQQDANELVKIVKEKCDDITNDKLVRLLSFTARGGISPITTFIGGLVAQEVQKAATDLFNPLNQWIFFESSHVLNDLMPEEIDCQPQLCRYDGQVICVHVILILDRCIWKALSRSSFSQESVRRWSWCIRL